MKQPKFKITNRAISDLNDIWNYTYETWSPKQADRYYKLLIDEFNFLAANPNVGKSVDYIKSGYRMSVVKSHLVFYRNSGITIEVVRVLHQRMDIERRINE